MRFNNVLRLRLSDTPLKQKLTSFVPNHEHVKEDDIQKLENFLMAKPNILVLTGAGISTESGIPGTSNIMKWVLFTNDLLFGKRSQ